MSDLLLSTNIAKTKQLSRLYKQGKIRRLYKGIYTDDLTSPIPELIYRNWLEIIAHIIPGAILSFRTAHDLRPIQFKKDINIIFVTNTYNKTITLPGLQIRVIKGERDKFIERILPNMARSNEARMLLENLSPVRGAAYKHVKTIGREGVELFLTKALKYRHEKGLQQIRDTAKTIAHELHLEYEFTILNLIISTLLATNDIGNLTTPYASALAKKEPYDNARIQAFNNLSLFLQKNDFIKRRYEYDDVSFKNIAFFESYFSNYIEGTEFLIDEAEKIVFSGKMIAHRHADSHDVLEHFRISDDYIDISKTPANPREFIELLQSRHARLMQERPNVDPGHFKTKPNRAGNTHFVAPADVVGTLTHAFEIYALLNDGFAKALFMHFILAEIHPFNDGNGRIARIMMNAELVKSQQYKIIIPNVYRDPYITSLRACSRDQYFLANCKMMDIAQAYTASIYWSDYTQARHTIETDQANMNSDVALPDFNKIIQALNLSQINP